MFNGNPMQMLQMFNQNPQQMIQGMMSGAMNQNPLMKRAMEMANGKTPEQVEQVCKNLCEQNGLDYNQAKQMFGQQFGMNVK